MPTASGIRTLKVGLVGAGMFGGDVHLRTYADLARCGIAPYLGRIGMDTHAREYGDVAFELVAVATRSQASAERAAGTFEQWTNSRPDAYFGETPWDDLLSARPDLDILAVATPDHLHAAPALAALNAGVHVVLEKPMTLDMDEADAIIEAADAGGLVVGLDMHKRYDPDHLYMFNSLMDEIG
ncbi:Gfo/Idh/MocA family oxidoreductase, partial [Candidatus Poribacteria bacterium]|nr:Gfo/Idh/MocA family oxidoreductase [Candidatus Poribacteria bacterium]